MQQTFQINTENLNANFLKSVKDLFGKTDVKIVIENIEKDKPISQKELFERSLAP